MRILFAIIAFWHFSLATLTAQSVAPAPAHLHAGWDSLLQRHVSETGKVNYKGFLADKTALTAYLDSLSAHVPTSAWTQADQLAYWINAYNAFTVDLIVRNYPTASIMRFDGGKTWDVKRIRLGGKKFSLNQIENEIIRPVFKDPRIHFAINCAAQSCPPLYNHAFEAGQLDSLLDMRTKAFINNKQYNTLGSKKVSISKIFEWYAADFGPIVPFLNQYSTAKIKPSATIQYQEYNWDLNE